MNKIAGSMLGFKHRKKNIQFKFDNKVFNKCEEKPSLKPGISQETILKLKLHNKNIIVNVYDKNNNLIKEFNRIKLAAKFVGLSPSTVSGYIKNGKL
jgi:hypothetical protein